MLVIRTTLFLAVAFSTAWAQQCPRLEGASASEMLSYVQAAAKDEANADCVSYAIYRLGEIKYEPAVSTLVNLLAFRRPPDENEKAGAYIRMRGFYPAVDALFEIGPPAAPSLLEAIEGRGTSAQARENAVEVWMSIYRDDPLTGIRLLRSRLDASNESSAKSNLQWALLRAQRWCAPANKLKCKLAAQSAR